MYFILQQKCAYYGEDDDYLVDMIYQRKKMFLSTQAYEVKCSLEEAEKVHELRKKLEREAPIKDSQPKLKEALISIFGNHAVSDITTKTEEKRPCK